MKEPTMESLNDEAWLAKMLGKPVEVFDGLTTPEIRRDRVRAAIISSGCQDKTAARTRSGRPLTFAKVFKRIYHEPLVAAVDSAV
jgi:hypothetical protein